MIITDIPGDFPYNGQGRNNPGVLMNEKTKTEEIQTLFHAGYAFLRIGYVPKLFSTTGFPSPCKKRSIC
jgi:hypothetical protein